MHDEGCLIPSSAVWLCHCFRMLDYILQEVQIVCILILLYANADFGLSINESNSQANTMEVGTPGYCGAAQETEHMLMAGL